jgi:hypothetical protein
MNDYEGRILISYAKIIDKVKIKQKIRLKNLLGTSVNGIGFLMFIYSVYNILQILFFK